MINYNYQLNSHLFVYNSMQQQNPPPSSLQNAVQQCLKQWHKRDTSALVGLTDLRIYQRLFVKEETLTADPRKTCRRLILDALDELAEHSNDTAKLIQRRFIERISVDVVARDMCVSPSYLFNLQQDALGQVVDIIWRKEQACRAKYQATLEERLDPPIYTQLVGIEAVYQQLQRCVLSEESPNFIAVDGIGGIGKTSLVDKLIREVAQSNHFYDIAWVRAAQTSFHPVAGLQVADEPVLNVDGLVDELLMQLDQRPLNTDDSAVKTKQLYQLLRKRRFLIVIDNLETTDDLQTLLPMLRQLATMTKLLLTTRQRLSPEVNITRISLAQLSVAESIVLLKQEARQQGLRSLANAPELYLEDIYETVGGNPLALKLVVGQLHLLPLERVLSNLKGAKDRHSEALYTYIYWQIWQALSENDRDVLLAMPLMAAPGGTYDQLLAATELSERILTQALTQLEKLSLVDVSGDLMQRRYNIHRLTETFLLTEVAKWQVPP